MLRWLFYWLGRGIVGPIAKNMIDEAKRPPEAKPIFSEGVIFLLLCLAALLIFAAVKTGEKDRELRGRRHGFAYESVRTLPPA